MNLCSVSVIKSLMAEAGITFRKEFGQNFLISPDVPERIADECADSADTVKTSAELSSASVSAKGV